MSPSFAAPPPKGRSQSHPQKKVPGKPLKKAAPEHSATLPRVPTGSEAHEKRVAQLREQIESVLHEKVLAHSRVGIIAEQLSDEDVLFSRLADQRFNPASNTKILTTAAAIGRLGGDWRYPTALYGPAPDVDGVITGDVVLRGSSDPSLGTGDLADLAHKLAEMGITRIHGDLVVDRRPIGYDGSGAEGLIFNRNAITVRVMPTEPKHAAVVRVEPVVAGAVIENHAMTVKGKRTRLTLDVHRSNDRLVIEVRGKVGDQKGTATITRKFGDGALMSGHTLGAILPDFGVTLDGGVRLGNAEKDASLLVEHASIPMADVSRISNKPSNNFVADSIYKTLGGVLYGLPGTLEKGTKAVSEWLVEEGLPRDTFHLVNGSGLTHENRITPADLMKLLRTIYFQPDLGPDFLPSLSVGGVDGTLRGRFAGNTVGLVRAKTGTLDGVSTLSGYVGDKGDVIVFSIMVEGFRWKRTPIVRQAQNQMVLAMLRFLRADLPGPEPIRPSPDAIHQDGIVGPPVPSPPVSPTSPTEDDDDESDKAEPGEPSDKMQ